MAASMDKPADQQPPSDSEYQDLLDAARKVKENSYCKYSRFKVGAAVLTEDGHIFSGCNVENASYPVGICAEQNTLGTAISHGHTKFRAILVTSDSANSFATPCGECRQFLAEFGLEWLVYVTKSDGTSKQFTVGQLLPESFQFESGS